MDTSFKFKNKTRLGISYIRFRSLAEENTVDNKGILIDWVSVSVQ